MKRDHDLRVTDSHEIHVKRGFLLTSIGLALVGLVLNSGEVEVLVSFHHLTVFDFLLL